MRWKRAAPDGARACLWIGAIAAVTRVVHLLDFARLPLFDRPAADAALYLDLAQRIATTGVPHEVFFKPPLFPVVLSAWLQAVGLDFFWLRVPFALLGAGTAVLTWLVARRLFDARVAFLAGLLQALHRSAVYFDGELLEIGLATFLQLGSLLAVLHAARSRRWRGLLGAGFLLGIGCLARPSFLAWGLVALVWLGRRRAIPAAIGALVAIAPVTLHNAWHGRDFVLISSNLGLNVYIGNNPWANGRIAATPELPAEPARARRAAESIAESTLGHELSPSQVSQFWMKRGLVHAASHPWQTLGLLGRKLFYTWNGAAIGDNEDLSGLSRYLWLFPCLPVGMWLLAPLGLLGLLRAKSTAVHDLRLARSFVWVQVLALLPFFVVERFRMPFAPGLAVLAAWSLVTLVTVRRAPWIIATLALLVACNLPLFGVRDAPAFDLDYRIAYAHHQRGDLDAALLAYRRAVERQPQSGLARNALGHLLAERGEQLDEAARLVESAFALDPDRSAHYAETLAMIELRRGDPEAASRACARGLAQTTDPPLRAALLLRRAEAAHALGRAEAAAEDLRTVLELVTSGPVHERARALQQRLDAAETKRSHP